MTPFCIASTLAIGESEDSRINKSLIRRGEPRMSSHFVFVFLEVL